MPLNIYKVSRVTDIDYDEYSAFICAAESEDDARRLHPRDWKSSVLATDGFWYDEHSTAEDEPWRDSSWPDNISTLKVELLGTATPSFLPGVLLALFHAG